jgi:hypothetical protein
MSDGFLNRRAALRATFGSLTFGLLFAAQGRAISADKDKGKDKDKDSEPEEIDMEKVPKEAKEAADQAVPKAKWTDAYTSKEDGDTYYELEGTDDKDRYVWIQVDAEGNVYEIQTEIGQKDVPKAVTKALTAKVPKFEIKTVYAVAEDDRDKVTEYHFEGKRPKDEDDIMVGVSADGKTVEVDI